jgi:hypothetical protein
MEPKPVCCRAIVVTPVICSVNNGPVEFDREDQNEVLGMVGEVNNPEDVLVGDNISSYENIS